MESSYVTDNDLKEFEAKLTDLANWIYLTA